MDKVKAQALQVTKEIIVKFIEIGRISPNNFADFFAPIYTEVLSTITADPQNGENSGEHPEA